MVDGFPPNVAPIAGLFFCAVYYAGKKGILVSSMIWLASYPLLSALQGYGIGMDFLASVLGFAFIVAVAFYAKNIPASSKREQFFTTFLGTLGGAVFFYFLTNLFCWVSDPVYEKNWSGLAQAQWTGHPTYPFPTWVYLRNSLAGNGVFIVLLLLSQWRMNSFFPAKVKAEEPEGFMEGV